jgi:predicted secreted hydrolase
MRKTFRVVVLLLLLAGLILAGRVLLFSKQAEPVQANLVGLPDTASSAGYERATGPRELVFPRDFGPHPDFQTEWWYYTGNLVGEDGRRFGFQLTFFRRALQPPVDRAARTSDWAAEQVYLAHFTITDVQGQRFYAYERFERGAAGLAGATADPSYKVWLRDWSAEGTGPDAYRLHAAEGDAMLDLTLMDRKGIILQGNQGYSQKGPEPGNASLYFSQPRMDAQGKITLAGKEYSVSGEVWMDREISTSALGQGQVGWDWFALQLEDGSELMAYVLRRSDGTIDEFSSGAFIAPDGTVTTLKREDYSITAEAKWRSPRSGGEYPARWRVQVPGVGLDVQVDPLLADQELPVTVVYWEGAVRVTGERSGKPVAGYGYVELTGYAKSMEGGL